MQQQKPQLRIFVAGATGVLGRRVVPLLAGAGHHVTALSRREATDRSLAEAGATPVRADLFDPESLREALAGHDTVINLATHIPPARAAFRRRAWKENDRIRTVGAATLAEAARAAGVSTLIQESITLPYRDCGAGWVDESAGVAATWNTRSALAAEAHARSFAEAGGRAVVLRFATLYAADAAHTRFMLDYARKGRSPVPGKRDAYLSLVHADDAARAVVAALDAPGGTYNVADNEPLTRERLNMLMAAAAGRPHLLRTPPWLVRLAGGQVAELLMRSQRVSNRSLRRQTGWQPRWPSAREGWPQVAGRG